MVESVVEYLALEWKISPKDAAALIHKNFDRFTG
jgi:hypothetical protein